MERGPQSYMEWRSIVIRHMPHLSKPQAVVLAMWSFGIVMTNCCGLSSVAFVLAQLLDQRESTLRERLRQWYKDKSARGCRKRAQARS